MCARRYDLTPTVISTLAFSALADQSEVDEQQGLMFLLAGAVLAFRNPRAHHAARTRPRKGRANLKRAEPWGVPTLVGGFYRTLCREALPARTRSSTPCPTYSNHLPSSFGVTVIVLTRSPRITPAAGSASSVACRSVSSSRVCSQMLRSNSSACASPSRCSSGGRAAGVWMTCSCGAVLVRVVAFG